MSATSTARRRGAGRLKPFGLDAAFAGRTGSPLLLPWALLAFGAALLWTPMVVDLHRHVWSVDPASQGPLALAMAAWLFWHKSCEPEAVAARRSGSPQPLAGLACLVPGLLLAAVGRSQGLAAAEVLALILCVFGLTLLLFGAALARRLWFCYAFLLFSVPLPGMLVDAITQPMKIAVSLAAQGLLQQAGFNVAREGVILYAGPYRLLVADACAGLHSLFTLEAIGLLYLNAVRHPSALRNGLMALFIVPLSFAANTLRVVLLVLVTLWFGDAAGRGLAHDFSGLLLFGLAFLMVVAADVFSRRLARWTGL